MTESQQAYAILDGRAEAGPCTGTACFLKTYRAVIAGGPDEQLPPEGILRDYLFKDSRKGRVFPVKRPRKGVREAVLEYRIVKTAGEMSLAEITLHTGRTHQIRVQFASPEASADRRRQIRKPRKRQHCPAELRPAVFAPGDRKAHGIYAAAAGGCVLETV